ncbi:sugar ABC transporter, permease protein [[Clostridium] cellulosi]|uniref:Sugar ABC transporter, permease protein n=1 Tax=[Clostridium] cellulosi TaxID=29343 RepID=A0A078KNC7_9FIRM|nr:sugar ABC transporter, permease protein [[Clostridium] cellulosi]
MVNSRKITAFKIIKVAICLIVAVTVIVPILWLFVSSFKDDREVIAYPPKFFPINWTLMQYQNVNDSVPILSFTKNSVIFAGLVTLISLLFDSMSGYAFARMNFKGKELLFGIILVTMMVPFQVVMTPLYIEIFKFKLLNTYAGLILPRATSAFGIYMMRSFFVSLPKSLEESARIDGCREFRIYWSIMMPLCKPALLTLGIFHFMNNWNDLLYPLMLTSSTDMSTLASGLATLVGNKVIKYGPTLAATMISILPILVLYIFAQKYFTAGISTTGEK